jgi:SagB-type dehydrogenase family enzyme
MLFTRRHIIKNGAGLLAGLLLAPVGSLRTALAKKTSLMVQKEAIMKLPSPDLSGTIPLITAMINRRSIRSFTSHSLILEQLSQLLWAAQGITGSSGFKRTAPSAGALYPMDVYVVSGTDRVKELQSGVYHYQPSGHSLVRILDGDRLNVLARASLSQMWMAHAPVNFVITAEYDRVGIKYGRRGVRYAMIEAGHIGQNIFLMAEALGLGAGIVGAFDDKQVVKVLHLPPKHEPLLIMPVGRKG